MGSGRFGSSFWLRGHATNRHILLPGFLLLGLLSFACTPPGAAQTGAPAAQGPNTVASGLATPTPASPQLPAAALTATAQPSLAQVGAEDVRPTPTTVASSKSPIGPPGLNSNQPPTRGDLPPPATTVGSPPIRDSSGKPVALSLENGASISSCPYSVPPPLDVRIRNAAAILEAAVIERGPAVWNTLDQKQPVTLSVDALSERPETLIYTPVTFAIKQHVKGKLPDGVDNQSSFTFYVYGGTVGNVTITQCDVPQFQVGQELLLFIGTGGPKSGLLNGLYMNDAYTLEGSDAVPVNFPSESRRKRSQLMSQIAAVEQGQ